MLLVFREFSQLALVASHSVFSIEAVPEPITRIFGYLRRFEDAMDPMNYAMADAEEDARFYQELDNSEETNKSSSAISF